MSEVLDALLTALPELPVVDREDLAHWASAADQRRKSCTAYLCALCHGRAVFAVLVEPGLLTSGLPRWLDLCRLCRHDVGRLAIDWPGDDAVLARFCQLQTEKAIPA